MGLGNMVPNPKMEYGKAVVAFGEGVLKDPPIDWAHVAPGNLVRDEAFAIRRAERASAEQWLAENEAADRRRQAEEEAKSQKRAEEEAAYLDQEQEAELEANP
ncbi:unnamed protein product [Sphagnum jensenii]